MMRHLEMTRRECAKQVYRVASDLMCHVEQVAELVEYENREKERELTEEIEIRQSMHTLEQLLKVMEELI